MDNANRPTGFGIIGAGFMGRTYAEVIAKYLVGDARLAAVAGGTRAAALASDYAVDCEEDWRDLCRRADVDAVIVASPHAAHVEQCIAAANAGKHVMVEKPMAVSVKECDDILRAANAAGVHVGVAFTQRKRLCPLRAKEILDSGELGRILHIQGWHVVPEGTANLPPWQGEGENIGVLMGHGVHCIDAVRWFTGEEIVSAFAAMGNYRKGYRTEASSDAILTTAGGIRANIVCSFEPPAPGFPNRQFLFHITCAEGLISLDAYGELKVARRRGAFETVAVQAPIDWKDKGFLDPVRLESYTAHLREFIEAARTKKPQGPTGRDGRQAVAVIEACYKSAKTGRKERIKDEG